MVAIIALLATKLGHVRPKRASCKEIAQGICRTVEPIKTERTEEGFNQRTNSNISMAEKCIANKTFQCLSKGFYVNSDYATEHSDNTSNSLDKTASSHGNDGKDCYETVETITQCIYFTAECTPMQVESVSNYCLY